MSQIILKNISYSYKNYYEPIFENVNFNIDTEWKLGLIGRNGRGKTTLLKLINGDFTPDKGKIIKNVITEIFPYENCSSYTNTLDVIKENIGGLRSKEEHLDEPEVIQQYLDADGFQIESRIKKELHLMQLPETLLNQDFDSLSGGEKTKIILIVLFLRQNSFILLDEPTNHLDIEGKQTVSKYLKKKKGFIVVSHDREFLDKVINHVISINKSDITIEMGNYSSWKNNKDLKEQYEFRTRGKLEREIKQLEKRADGVRGWAGFAEKQKYEFKTNSRANGAKSYMRQAKNSEIHILNNIDEKKSLLLNFEKEKTLEISQDTYDEEWLLNAKNLSFGYSDRKIISEFNIIIYPGDIVWIRGKNGAGKSTLLHLLSQEIPNDFVEYTENLVITKSYQEPLWNSGFVRDLFMEQTDIDADIFNNFVKICKDFDLPDNFLERPLETYSSGEKKKIDIAKALAVKNQIIFLDEPLNYMDVYFREQLEKAILQYRPTMIFVDHDEFFGKNISNVVVEL